MEPSQAECRLSPPPDGFVDIAVAVPGIGVDPRYHGANNFTGAPLPGYEAKGIWLRAETAHALAVAQKAVVAQGLTLLVLDGYRPMRASAAMVKWTQTTHQTHLLTDGYIASKSGHNHGHTVDLTLATLDGQEVDMGTSFDHFGVESHHNAAGLTDAQVAHRKQLRAAMEAAGFVAYSKEWWHYRLPIENTQAIDVPMACEVP